MERFIAAMAYALIALVMLLFVAGVVVTVMDDPRPPARLRLYPRGKGVLR